MPEEHPNLQYTGSVYKLDFYCRLDGHIVAHTSLLVIKCDWDNHIGQQGNAGAGGGGPKVQGEHERPNWHTQRAFRAHTGGWNMGIAVPCILVQKIAQGSMAVVSLT